MRKVLFINDGPRWKTSTNVYFGKVEDINLINRYLHLGDSVDFLMRSNLKDISDNNLIFANHNSKFIEVPTFNRPSSFYKIFKAKRIIRETIKHYDVLIIRLPSTIGSIALSLTKKSNIPYIVEVVGCPYDTLSNYSLLGKIYAPFAMKKLKCHVLNAERVVYVTQKYLQSKYPSNGICMCASDVILTSFDETVMVDKKQRYQTINKNNIIHIATMGAVNVPYKGHDIVLKALSVLKNEGITNIRYHIAGLGGQERLRNICTEYDIENFVIFEGAIPHNEINRFLKTIDIYVHPSRTEGLPRSIVEAMSVGCVCIGSNAGGIPELLDSKVVFENNSVSDFIKQFKNIYLNNQELVKQSEINYNKALSFDFNVLEQKRQKFYIDFLKDKFNYESTSTAGNN